MGVLISSAVIPAALTLLWNRQSKWAACLSPLLGVTCSVSAWLITTKIQFGSITIQTSGSNISMLVGNVVALCAPILFVPVLSWIAPDKQPYDFHSMKEIKRDDTKNKNILNINPDEIEREMGLLTRNSKVARITAVVLTLCLVILWPWPMYGTAYVFTKPFFTGWIILGIIWMLISFIIVGIYPIIEGRHSIASVCK